MLQKIALIISIIFHPLFVPIYGMIMVLNSRFFYFPSPYKIVVGVIFAIGVGVVPLLCSVLMYSPKSLTRLAREKRHFVYAVTLLSYLFTLYLLYKMNFPFALLIMYAGCIVTLLALMIINFFWKISAHTMVAGCFCGYLFLFAIYTYSNPVALIFLSVMLAGIIGWARLQLQAHTTTQVLTGYAVGALAPLISTLLFY